MCHDYRNPSDLRIWDQTLSIHIRHRPHRKYETSTSIDLGPLSQNPHSQELCSALPCSNYRPGSDSHDRPSALLSGAGFLHFTPERQNYALYIHNPSVSISCNDVERRYFDSFLRILAIDFSGYFETPFWTKLIPRECHNEPIVMHATIALSALYKSSEAMFDPPNRELANLQGEHLSNALMQYNRAICLLRRGLSREDFSISVRLALIACVLFGCFESFYGNLEIAVQHISSGLGILKDFQNNKTRMCRQKGRNLGHVEPELRQALERLKLQTSSIVTMKPTCYYPFDDQDSRKVIDSIPSLFTTVDEAFPFGIDIATRCLLHLRRSAMLQESQAFTNLLASEQADLGTALAQWHVAFRPIFLEANQNLTKRSQLGVLQLHTCITAFIVVVSMSTSREEVMFDKFTGRFQEIVSLCGRILEKEQELRVLSGLKMQFGLGLIMPLFYTSTRCRDRTVRQNAIALLNKWPCRNGLWDSWQAARVAEWIARLEDEGRDANGLVSEEWRVRMHSLDISLQGHEIHVECVQGSGQRPSRIRKAKFSRDSSC